ncbi:MAG: protein kinase [Bryobacterales bacterium]|nr:protein kinase [Bryobacterales bacterium]
MVDVSKLCMGCMEERGAEPVCPRCNYREGTEPASALHLRPRSELQGQYLIGRVLGHGGFGITYLGWDLNLERKVAVKEYLPGGVAVRTRHATEVMPSSGDLRKDFEYGLDRYLDEARTVARFQAHPAIVSVLNFFRANGTAYLIMEYLEGATLERYLETNKNRTTIDTVLTVMVPVMEALQTVHQQGILHRDVSPDNIYITRKWQVKVLDFGAARYALGQKSRNLSVILKEGYAPVEQYHSKGNQGPWTDVYACAATMYRALTGVIPPGSLDRMSKDELQPPSQLGAELSDVQEKAILKALAIHPEKRFHTMQAFRDAIMGLNDQALVANEPLPAFIDTQIPDEAGRISSRPPTSQRGAPVSQQPPPTPVTVIPPAPAKPLPKWALPAGAAAVLLFLALLGWNSFREQQLESDRNKQQDSTRQALEAEIQKQREMAAETEQRDRDRAQLEQQLNVEEAELKKRQEELEKAQKGLQRATPQRTPATKAPTPPAPAPPATATNATTAPAPPAAATPAAVPATPAAPTYEDLIRQAQEATRNRNYPQSTQLSEQAIKLNAGRPEAYANLGWIALYGTGDLATATRHYQKALQAGGTVWFRIHHDHANGSFSTRCMGDLGISRDTLQFIGQDGSHNFKVARNTLKEVKEHRMPFRSVSGDFHVKLGDDRQYNMVSVTNAKAVRELIVSFLR